MKRTHFEVAGGPKHRRSHPRVAGQPVSGASVPVASTVAADELASMARPQRTRGIAGSVDAPPARVTTGDQALLADFADFMSGEEELSPTPDPTFKGRLRRRLWRMFVHSYLGQGDSTH